jgi:hypothetical protein
VRYWGVACAFTLVGFVVANLGITCMSLLLWRIFRPRGATALFVLRVLPAAGALIIVGGLVLPSFLRFEPSHGAERVGFKLVPLALLVLALVAAGAHRAIGASRAGRRLVSAWLSEGRLVGFMGESVPVYRIQDELPVATLTGTLRPRIFVSGRFLDAMTPGERTAVLRHEVAHLAARDNLKQALLRLAPDPLPYLEAGRRIEAAWRAAVEDAADDRAAGRDRAAALDVASALLRAARMIPPGAPRRVPASGFCDGATLSHRVRRLLAEPEPSRSPALLLATAIALAPLSALALAWEPASRAVYSLTEAAVRLLQ